VNFKRLKSNECIYEVNKLDVRLEYGDIRCEY